MNTKSKFVSFLNAFLIYFVIWLLAMTLYRIFRSYGTAELFEGTLATPPAFIPMARILIAISILLAILTVISDGILNIKRTLHMSYGKVILLHLITDVAILIVATIFMYRLFHIIGLYDMAPDKDVFHAIFSRNMIVAGVYITAVNVLINIARLVNTNMGKGNFWKLLSGKYHSPREEEHVFMFLDLKSSTTAAEKIGHIKYSEMIQECYFDLTLPLQKTNGQVYQYVGDEAVIMWSPRKKEYDASSLALFFNFDKILSEKRDTYESKYGWHPQFKAGVHVGTVIATQVGALKREIAYHGDVMNSTARIQALCNEKEAKILISEELLSRMYLEENHPYNFKDEGSEILKGKAQRIKVFSVNVREI